MIKLEGVNKYFNRHKSNEIHVINNTTLELGNNGLVSLLGPSGCGKTTLLNSISGLCGVNKGAIYINGKRITNKSSYYIDKVRALNIGYIFQDYNLIDNLTVYDNVALVLKINGIKDKEEIKKRVEYSLNKVNMFRYRNRYASNLSGGEKQRVSIARAIVKNPNIIIADEPTGNLDSKNTLEVMNIIKAISKEKLVLLVTHETNLAKFYSDRIIELEDGKIVNDYINNSESSLDYKVGNNIYLKDFKNIKSYKCDNVILNYYSNDNDNLVIDLAYQNGILYLKSDKDIKVSDEDINLINDNYKNIEKNQYEKYDFDFNVFKTNEYKYSSIFNIFSLIKNGFKKILDYTLVKKILLIGFFFSGIFITNSVCNSLGSINIKDESFVSINKNYITVNNKNISVEDYLKLESREDIKYIIPTSSSVSFTVKYDDYYQSTSYTDILTGSIVSSSLINDKDIVYGRNIINNNEVIIDIMTFDKFYDDSSIKNIGVLKYEDMIGRKLYINNMDYFEIVGIVNNSDPSIYVNSNLINIIYNSTLDDVKYIDYDLVSNMVNIIKGSNISNDYEVLLPSEYKDSYKLNSYINETINSNKLKVVGFYESDSVNKYIVNNNTIKYDLIVNSSNASIISEGDILDELRSEGFNVSSSYDYSKSEYINSRKDSIRSTLVVSLIIFIISLIEIYLMIRASFLSRIKEIGIYRAIGVKKSDIRKMFVGEIISITTVASVPGVLFMSYVVKTLTNIDYFSINYIINWCIVIGVIIFVYLFNVIVGLIPVNFVLCSRVSKILSRNDV